MRNILAVHLNRANATVEINTWKFSSPWAAGLSRDQSLLTLNFAIASFAIPIARPPGALELAI